MPLLGSAAMLMSYDVNSEAIEEHDRWHTHEHLPERLSIPGFHRGTRWMVSEGSPRYMVLYEVESLSTLASPAYLARLNSPTPWTARIMGQFKGMTRGLCSVLGSFGYGQGGIAGLIRFSPTESRATALHRWLLEETLPALAQTPGLGSAHLLQGTQAAAMTNEQRIRGADRGIDSAVILTGYNGDALAAHARTLLAANAFTSRVAGELSFATYHTSYSLSSAEIAS